MKIEVRANGTAHISGYVNVTGKRSRPVITGKGQRVIEIIEERAFAEALGRGGNVQMTKDHDPKCVLAETRAHNLTLREDAIGLWAESDITDERAVEEATHGKIKGWSFGMKNIVDEIEERADGLPIRHVKRFDLDHITLVVNKTPVYAATSIEVRANEESTLECRAFDDDCELMVEKKKDANPNAEYHKRFENLAK